jgi:hypothetical protein
MDPNEANLDEILARSRGALTGPVSSFLATRHPVVEQIRADGLSLPAVATRLRQWAKSRGDIANIVLGHTPKRYTIAILMDCTDMPILSELKRELVSITDMFGGRPAEIYPLGSAHANAAVFRRYGSYEIYRRPDESSSSIAA